MVPLTGLEPVTPALRMRSDQQKPAEMRGLDDVIGASAAQIGQSAIPPRYQSCDYRGVHCTGLRLR